MLDYKELYRRFRDWQLNPFQYENRNVTGSRCANCGMELTDNYCPRCGQKGGVGRIGWSSIRLSFMQIWGMDSRSLPYTLWQLLLRPGYLISDYISGRRQVSFPPVNMLTLVAFVYVMLENLSERLSPEPESPVSTTSNNSEIIDRFGDWVESNPGWTILLICSLLILPTWMLFRHSVRHARHTLPEGFFIQVFMSTLMIMIIIICMITTDWLFLLIPVYYIVAYRQLFGYGLWGTLWRFALCVFDMCVMIIALFPMADIFVHHTITKGKLGALALIIMFTALINIIACYINRRSKIVEN